MMSLTESNNPYDGFRSKFNQAVQKLLTKTYSQQINFLNTI